MPDLKVRVRKRVICDSDGWPVEQIRGRWFLNLLRLLIHGRRIRYVEASGELRYE